MLKIYFVQTMCKALQCVCGVPFHLFFFQALPIIFFKNVGKEMSKMVWSDFCRCLLTEVLEGIVMTVVGT